MVKETCASAPCQHGAQCVDYPDGYMCLCPAGTTGKCSSLAMNGWCYVRHAFFVGCEELNRHACVCACVCVCVREREREREGERQTQTQREMLCDEWDFSVPAMLRIKTD